MFERLLKWYLKSSDKAYLVPFLEGLVHLGRPSSVLFPVELLEQGLGLVLSGLSNTLAAQTNLDWVWPYWLERQQDPSDPAFIPTGVNLLCANLTRRNWTSLGFLDSAVESLLDPVGMLTPRSFGWSCFPYLRVADQLWAPPQMRERVQQSLEEGFLPTVQTTYLLDGPIRWSSQAQALVVAGEELISFSHRISHMGENPVSLVFGLSLRPYNPLTLGHINRLAIKNRLWRVNGKPGLLLLSEPDRVAISDRHLGDPLTLPARSVRSESMTSRTGILAGVCEYDLTLQPGETRDIASVFPLANPKTRPRLKFRGINRESIASAQTEAAGFWRERASQGTTLSVPAPALNVAFQALKNHLHVFDDLTHFSPGTFFYNGHWFRDGAFLALGFENAGLGDRVAPKLPAFQKRQTFDGFFRSQNGEWDSNGQAIWTMVNHVRRSGNQDLLETLYPAMRKGCTWLEQQCRKTQQAQTPHFGLLPPGISAEHFGPNDHYFWDNYWGLAGLKQTVWAARKLGRTEDARKLSNQASEFRQHIEHAQRAALYRTQGSVLPTSPYRNPDSAAIGNLVALSPLDLYPAREPWVRPTVEFLVAHNLRDGLFFQKIIHTGLNVYLSAQLARALQVLGDPRWRDILEAALRYGGGTLTWPEAIHPQTGGGCMGDGDHGWAVAEMVSLMRDMMVREQGSELLLGSGWPVSWWTVGAEFVLERATTLAGTLSYRLRVQEHQLDLDWELQPNPLSEPLSLSLVVPSELKLERAPAEKVTLPAGSGSLSLLYSRTEALNPQGVIA